MLVVKKDTVLKTKAGRLTEGMEIPKEILEAHPHLKENGEEKNKSKEASKG